MSNLNKGSKDSMWLHTTFRRAAYDFHIPDSKPDFLSQLNPHRTAAVLADAGVQMLQLCAKSHWGLSLYPTQVGKQHPLLNGRNYFGEVLDALNARGVKCLAYISDYWDNYAGMTHPEWRQQGTLQGAENEQKWITMCPQSGYRSYLLEQILEVLERYPVAGVFTDMTGFRGYCNCTSCRRDFRRDTGLEIPTKEDWSSEQWRQFIQWRYRMTELCMAERRAAIKRARPDAIFAHNYHGFLYNHYALSHEPWRAHQASDYVTIEIAPFDIQSHETFGLHFGFGLLGGSQAAKFARDVGMGKSYEAVGARCATGHDFTEKPMHQMMLEAYSVVAHGCPYTIIESAGMDGLPIESGWRDIGSVFHRIQALEPWLLETVSMRHVGIVFSKASADFYTARSAHRSIEEFNGFYKVCVEAHLPVTILFDQTLESAEELDKHAVIVLPDVAVLNESQAAHLEAYVRRGGGLVVTHETSLYQADGQRRENFLLADVLGVDMVGEPTDAVTWLIGLQCDQERDKPVRTEFLWSGAMKALLRTEPTYVPVRAKTDAQTLAERWKPPFERPRGLDHSSHFEPPYAPTGEPLVIVHPYGNGRCAYVSPRVGATFLREGQYRLRELVKALLSWSAGQRPPVRTNAPMAVEIVANRQPKLGRYVLHFLNFAVRPPLPTGVNAYASLGILPAGPSWTVYDEILPLGPFQVEVATGVRPRELYKAPGRERIAWTYENGVTTFSVDGLEDALSVCIECG